MDDDERNVCCSTDDDDHHQKLEEVVLPGFRFHPTDEELVGFYLKRKIQQRPLSIELIKQLDIYKHDPWDLPKLATTGEKEWYFYCPRDRKYRNSTRPNRVTGAGFWKATGTDRPIYSSEGTGSSKCIGLKKSLVFYKGRAAKGVKTDWMMHEFRLPASHDGHHHHHHPTSSPKRSFHLPKTPNVQDAWAICRIFKKTTSTGQRALSHSWVSTAISQHHHHHHHQMHSRQDDQSDNNVNYVPSPADHDHILMNVMNASPKTVDHHQLQHNIPTTAPPPPPPMTDFSNSYKLINQYLSLNTAAGDLASLIFSSSSSPIHFSNTCNTSTGDGSSSSLVSSSFSHDNIGGCESSSLQLGNINLNHLADDHDQWIQAVRSNPGFHPFGFPLIGLGDSWKPNLMWQLD